MRSPASTTELADMVRHAAAHDTPLRFVGGGTWMHGGGPFVDRSRVSLRDHAGVVAYEPGDLVITLRAGTTLAELEAIAGEHGQMFALAPYGAPESTIGAVVATAAQAPLALGDVLVRDVVLGCTVVSGTGETLTAGGRVVKNVAGFDLVRLHTGAWGTLGAITEVTVRLHAIPAVDAILVGTMEHAHTVDEGLTRVVPALVANRAPLPMILQLTPGRAPEVWARVSGNSARAAALTDRLAALGVTGISRVASAAPLRASPDDATILRLQAARSDAVPFILAARAAFATASLSYDPARGSLRVVLPPTVDATAAIARCLSAAHDRGATHPIAAAIEQGATVAHVRQALEQGIKQAFDPRDICNRQVT